METIKEEKKADLEKRVELLEKVVKALCKWKQDYVYDTRVKIANWSEMRCLRNEFEYQMENVDFDYKD